jgi:hypothetical protein
MAFRGKPVRLAKFVQFGRAYPRLAVDSFADELKRFIDSGRIWATDFVRPERRQDSLMGCSTVLGLVNLILPIKEAKGNLPVVGAVILGQGGQLIG